MADLLSVWHSISGEPVRLPTRWWHILLLPVLIEVPEGVSYPPLYGRAYYRWDRHAGVGAPIPLNWIVGAAVTLYARIRFGLPFFNQYVPMKVAIDARRDGQSEGYKRGYTQGHAVGRIEGMKEYEAAVLAQLPPQRPQGD